MREEEVIPKLSTEQLKQFIKQKESYIRRSKNIPKQAQITHLIAHQELNLKRAKKELENRGE